MDIGYLFFRFRNKVSIKIPQDFKEDGSMSHTWRLCSLQQMEEMKSVIRITPIWSSTINIFVFLAQLNTLSVLQAETMDIHLGKHFQLLAGSFGIFTMPALTLFFSLLQADDQGRQGYHTLTFLSGI